jgi:hypothetical protein
MIYLESAKEREEFWNKKHLFPKLSQALLKKGYRISNQYSKDRFVGGGVTNIEMIVLKQYTIGRGEAQITIKFRPNHSKYHYSVETNSGSYALGKESRRFRYKSPDLTAMCDIVDYLYKKLLAEREVEERSKQEKEKIHKKRLEEATEISRAIGAKIDANVVYGTFSVTFKTFDGTEIKMNFHLTEDGDIRDFDIDGSIKRHHFYSLIDSLRKSVPDSQGGGFVKKRRFDLTSDIVTRIAKNEKITKIGFSTIRSWKRNFNLEGKK